MLTADNISKEYTVKEKGKNTKFHAVKPVSLELRNGERYALVGESSSGKTTLARMLSGIIKPTNGQVMLEGEKLSDVHNKRSIYRKLQLVFQDSESALNPHMTVYHLIAEPLRNLLGLSREEEKAWIWELMKCLDLPEELLSRKPRELSGGQQKRVCIARAIGVNPEIVIFDEAVSGLDVIVRKHILELLDELQRELGCTYLFITHDIDIALYIADTVFVMKDGEIVERAQYKGSTDCFKHEYSQLLLK